MDAVLWLLWIVVAILTLAAELLTLALFFGSLSLAALVTAAASLVLPLPGQLAVFSVVSLLMLLAVRPAALRVLPRGSGPDDPPVLGPVGRRALATERITNLQGQIRIGSGEFWTARAEMPDTPIDLGGEVEVVGMEGLTAVVKPVRPSGRAIPDSPTGADPFGLSAREVEVLKLLALGLSNAEIAARLVLSQRTVDHHVSHILDKTGASGRLEAVRLGLEYGLVHLDNAHPPE
jgi:membrane protein implicated in regulation of membrane protease activity/DNA-binding CsgD family transcriptional regulator